MERRTLILLFAALALIVSTGCSGEKKRKVVRGNTISAETTFLNFSIVEAPKGKKKEPEPEEPVEEAPVEEKEE